MADKDEKLRKTYFNDKELDEEYASDGLRHERAIEEERPIFERPAERIEIVKRRSMPRMEETKFEELKLEKPEILGNLFDRVEFLKERIDETRHSISTREELHNQIISEVDRDIADKENMQSQVTDFDEKRSIKLDVSILRKEKRTEAVQFWKDIVELKNQLRELMEQFETESKIASIFSRAKE